MGRFYRNVVQKLIGENWNAKCVIILKKIEYKRI